MTWQIRPAGTCPRCLEPVGLVVLSDGRRYRCTLPPRLLNTGLDLDHAHERPARHDAECPGVPRAELAFARWASRVTAAIERVERRLAAGAAGAAPAPHARGPEAAARGGAPEPEGAPLPLPLGPWPWEGEARDGTA